MCGNLCLCDLNEIFIAVMDSNMKVDEIRSDPISPDLLYYSTPVSTKPAMHSSVFAYEQNDLSGIH